MYGEYQTQGKKSETRRQLEECYSFGLVSTEQYQLLNRALQTEGVAVSCESCLVPKTNGKHITWTIKMESDFK